jgi:hypothetical protein
MFSQQVPVSWYELSPNPMTSAGLLLIIFEIVLSVFELQPQSPAAATEKLIIPCDAMTVNNSVLIIYKKQAVIVIIVTKYPFLMDSRFCDSNLIPAVRFKTKNGL